MSGGHYDYAYLHINVFNSLLERDIEKNKTPDEFGYCPNYSKETIRELKKILKYCKLAENLMYHTEWLQSGDDGEETFLKHLKKLRF